MKVSVAICTYNGAKFIEEQLRSILSQSRIPDEIVLRDDRSTDGTLELAGALLRSFPGRVDLRRNEQRFGVSRNFEGAIRACSGDAIFLSDQDDVWMPDKVDHMAGLLERDPEISWLFSDATCIDEQGARLSGSLWRTFGLNRRVAEGFRSGRAFEEILKAPRITGATMAVRARAARIALPVGPGWVHDHWISMLLAYLGEQVVAIERPLISYRIHAAQEIGVRATTLAHRLKRSRSTGGPQYLEEAAQVAGFLSEADARARASGIEVPATRRRRGGSKVRHLEARGKMREAAYPAALAMALQELAGGRYRYSYSRFAFLKDAFGL